MSNTTASARSSRRSFLRSLAVGPFLLVRGAPFQPTSYPFSLGVASGYPSPDGVALWTRLAPEPLRGGGMPREDVDVDWEVARDEAMGDVVQRGTARATPGYAHSVHVELHGLEPDRWYWYRFRAGSEMSPVGRTKTAPDVDTDPERLRFAFASCQHYEHGFFGAYRHMAREDLDLVVHLGDYIYEGTTSRSVRRHPAPEPVTVDDYRDRYALYKSDPDLQAAHAAFPWIVTWDDHEVDNDYAADRSEDLAPRPWFLARRAAAYQAYYEHMPLRRGAVPLGGHVRLYTRLTHGRLACFHVLDDRQFRSPQPCPRPGEGGSNTLTGCEERFDPRLSLLGADQESWLFAGLSASSSRWNVIAQQTRMARTEVDDRVWTDGWDGYPAARHRILDFLAKQRPANPVVIGGDVHSYWVSDLPASFDEPQGPAVATELVGTSITTRASEITQERMTRLRRANPHVRYAETSRRGYVRASAGRERLVADLRAVVDAADPDTEIETLRSFVVENGRAGALDQASGPTSR